MLLLILSAIFNEAFAFTCYKCATPGLKANWQLTGFLTPPADQVYTDDCHSTLTGAPAPGNCPTGVCLEMIIPLPGRQWEVLRGCYNDLLTGAPSGYSPLTTPTAPIIPDKAEDGDPFSSLCTKYDVKTYYVNGTNALNLCHPKAGDDEICNGQLKARDTASISKLIDCKSAAEIECVQCQYFDGDGACSPSMDNPSSGPACAKIRGTLAGHTYEERAPTYILPYDASKITDCFDITYKKNLTLHFGALPGSTRFREKRSIAKRSVAPIFKGSMCYCSDGKHCNGSPTIIGFSTTILLALTAIPLFS